MYVGKRKSVQFWQLYLSFQYVSKVVDIEIVALIHVGTKKNFSHFVVFSRQSSSWGLWEKISIENRSKWESTYTKNYSIKFIVG